MTVVTGFNQGFFSLGSLPARGTRRLQVMPLRGELRAKEAFLLSKYCPQFDKAKHNARWLTRIGQRYGKTNRSVLALVRRLEQAGQIVTYRCWLPDELTPHGHLDCEQTEALHSWSNDPARSPGIAMP
jgi:hypothetical protein